MQNSDRDKIAHVLRRFGLGASEQELQFYGDMGLSKAVETLLSPDSVEESFKVPIANFRLEQAGGRIIVQSVAAHWALRLMSTRRPLLEKMTVFWHNHFATSASKVNIPPVMYAQIETLRENALGKFPDLLLAMAKDPAMIFWLDGQYNVVGKPNENFAREVMELFTLGVGHYSEKDIQEAARAFTGWTYRRVFAESEERKMFGFFLARRQHDTGEKTVFGKTGSFEGEDILTMLCGNPQTARFLTKKIWNWFVWHDPSDKDIEPFAKKFADSGLDIKVLLREIMLSPEFHSDRARRAIFKTPVDFVYSTVRQLGIGEPTAELAVDKDARAVLQTRPTTAAVMQATQAMGMQLLFPPDVAGWSIGPGWVSSATMVERISWADRLFGASEAKNRAQIRYQALRLFGPNAPVKDAVAKLVSVFDAQLTPKQLEQLEAAAKDAAGGDRIRLGAENRVASHVCRLMFGSPQFQMC